MSEKCPYCNRKIKDDETTMTFKFAGKKETTIDSQSFNLMGHIAQKHPLEFRKIIEKQNNMEEQNGTKKI